MLVLSADVGEGHVSSARALVAQARAWGGPTVVHRDGLRCFGRVAAFVIREGYRIQLRYAQWAFPLLYALFMHVPGARRAGTLLLYRLGRRRLAGLVARERADVVVSTHPALTAALGEMRRRRRLSVPVCAAITDFADWKIWTHRGVDLHLVCHEAGMRAVECTVGPGRAIVALPLVAPELFDVSDKERLRAELAIPQGRPVVLVSGGGWGVGDLEGATCAALASADTFVVCVCGRNERLRARLAERFRDHKRVRVLGYTSRMRDLLRAADVVVHSTGGVTSLEAIACGTRLVAYGADFAHIRLHNRTLASLGLAELCSTRRELAAKLATLLAPGEQRHAVPVVPAARAPALLAELEPRVRPIPVWRVACARAAASLVVSVTLACWMLATDDARWATAHLPGLRPTVAIAREKTTPATVVEAPRPALAPLGRLLLRRCGTVAVAAAGDASARDLRPLFAARVAVMPALHARSSLHLLAERRTLARTVRRLGLRHRFSVLVSGRNVAPVHYLLARSIGGEPLAAAVELEIRRSVSGRALARQIASAAAARQHQRIVVLRIHDGSPATLAALGAALSRLQVTWSPGGGASARAAVTARPRASTATATARIARPPTSTAISGPCAEERS